MTAAEIVRWCKPERNTHADGWASFAQQCWTADWTANCAMLGNASGARAIHVLLGKDDHENKKVDRKHEVRAEMPAGIDHDEFCFRFAEARDFAEAWLTAAQQGKPLPADPDLSREAAERGVKEQLELKAGQIAAEVLREVLATDQLLEIPDEFHRLGGELETMVAEALVSMPPGEPGEPTAAFRKRLKRAIRGPIKAAFAEVALSADQADRLDGVIRGFGGRPKSRPRQQSTSVH